MTTSHDSRTNRAEQAAEAMEDLKRRVKSGAEDLIEDGEEALDNMRSKFTGTVREHPVTSLVVAGGVGLLLGLLIARRR